MTPIQELELRMMGQPAIAEPSVYGRRKDGQPPWRASLLHNQLRTFGRPDLFDNEFRSELAKELLSNPDLPAAIPVAPAVAEKPPAFVTGFTGESGPLRNSLPVNVGPQQGVRGRGPAMIGLGLASVDAPANSQQRTMPVPPSSDGQLAMLMQTDPQRARAILQEQADQANQEIFRQAKENVAGRQPDRQFGGQRSNLSNAMQGAPPNGYTYGFGGPLTPGAEEKIARAIAAVQPTSTPGGYTASQKRQLAVPVEEPSIYRQALEDKMPFGNTTDKMARAANAADPSRVDVTQDPKTGRWIVKGAGVSEDRSLLSDLERRVTAKGGTITPEQEAKAAKGALRRFQLKAKRWGMIPAGADEFSTLAEIKSAEAELEARKRNRTLGLPEDFGLAGGPVKAGSQSPLDAGIAAVRKLKAEVKAERGKFAEPTREEKVAAFTIEVKAREQEIAAEREMAQQKALADAQAQAEKDRQAFQERLAKDQLAATSKESQLDRDSQERAGKKNRKTQTKIAKMESEDRKIGFEQERNQELLDLAAQEWAAGHGNRPARTAKEKQEVRQLVREKAQLRDELSGKAPIVDQPTVPVSTRSVLDPVEAQRRLQEESQTPGETSAILGLLGVGMDAPASALGKALAQRMQSGSPLAPANLLELQEHVKAREQAMPEFYDPRMLTSTDPVGPNALAEMFRGTGRLLGIPGVAPAGDPGVGMYLLDELIRGDDVAGAMERAKKNHQAAFAPPAIKSRVQEKRAQQYKIDEGSSFPPYAF